MKTSIKRWNKGQYPPNIKQANKEREKEEDNTEHPNRCIRLYEVISCQAKMAKGESIKKRRTYQNSIASMILNS